MNVNKGTKDTHFSVSALLLSKEQNFWPSGDYKDKAKVKEAKIVGINNN